MRIKVEAARRGVAAVLCVALAAASLPPSSWAAVPAALEPPRAEVPQLQLAPGAGAPEAAQEDLSLLAQPGARQSYLRALTQLGGLAPNAGVAQLAAAIRQAPPFLQRELLKDAAFRRYARGKREIIARLLGNDGLSRKSRTHLRKLDKALRNVRGLRLTETQRGHLYDELNGLEGHLTNPRFARENPVPALKALLSASRGLSAAFDGIAASGPERARRLPRWPRRIQGLAPADARLLYASYRRFLAQVNEAYDRDRSPDKNDFREKLVQQHDSLKLEAPGLGAFEARLLDGQVLVRLLAGSKVYLWRNAAKLKANGLPPSAGPAPKPGRELDRYIAYLRVNRFVDYLLWGRTRSYDARLDGEAPFSRVLASLALPWGKTLELSGPTANPAGFVALAPATLFPFHFRLRTRSAGSRAFGTLALPNGRIFEVLGPDKSPFRSVTLIDASAHKVSELPSLGTARENRWKLWMRSLPLTFTPGEFYGNLVRASGIAAGTALITHLAFLLEQSLAPDPGASNLWSVIIPAAMAFLKAFFIHGYVEIGDRPKNPTIKALFRLGFNMPASLALVVFNSLSGWGALLDPMAWYAVLAVASVERQWSVATNIPTEIERERHIPSSPFKVRYQRTRSLDIPVPFRKKVAAGLRWADRGRRGRLGAWAGDIEKAVMRDASITLGLLEIARFPIKPLGVLIDPILMSWTGIPVPLITLSLWGLGYVMEAWAYYAVKRLIPQNPAVRENFERLLAHSKVWQRLEGIRRPAPRELDRARPDETTKADGRTIFVFGGPDPARTPALRPAGI